MREVHVSPDVRASGRSVNWRNMISWVSVGILVGTEVFGALFAGAWALGGTLELPPTLQWILYGLALAGSVAIMVPFLRRAASIDPLTDKS